MGIGCEAGFRNLFRNGVTIGFQNGFRNPRRIRLRMWPFEILLGIRVRALFRLGLGLLVELRLGLGSDMKL